jgi:hypothetical protein
VTCEKDGDATVQRVDEQQFVVSPILAFGGTDALLSPLLKKGVG